MDPVLYKRTLISCFTLCYLIFVMWKDQIITSCVNIKIIAKMFAAHCRAFYMPARSALTPLAFPIRLTFFSFFPECKIKRIIFLFVNFYSCTNFKIINFFSAKFSTPIKPGNIVKNISVNVVSIPFLFQRFNHFQYIIHMIGCFGINISFFYFQFLQIFKKSVDIILSYRMIVFLFFVCFLNNFIINIGYVHHIFYFIPFIFKISSQYIGRNKRTCITNMEIIIDSGSTNVNLYIGWIDGLKFFFFI